MCPHLRDDVDLQDGHTEREVLHGPHVRAEEVGTEQLRERAVLVVGARLEPHVQHRLPVQPGGTHVHLGN